MTKQHLAELVATLATEPHKNRPAHLIAEDAIELLRMGARAATLSVRLCNGEGWQRRGLWDDKDEARYEQTREKILAACNAIAENYHATCTLGGDPRGYVLKLQLQSQRSNTFGKDGWGVA